MKKKEPDWEYAACHHIEPSFAGFNKVHRTDGVAIFTNSDKNQVLLLCSLCVGLIRDRVLSDLISEKIASKSTTFADMNVKAPRAK